MLINLFRGKKALIAGLFCAALTLAGCGSKAAFTPGTYEGQGEGREGIVSFSVTFSKNRITDIQVIGQNETAGIGQKALETMKSRILKEQSLAVDTVSGATVTSKAMLSAVAEAAVKAGADPSDLQKAEAPKKPVKTEKHSADILVIGAGASGVSAAVAAADKGAKVIVIEKTGTIGGASNLSWAGKFYNSSVAVKSGLKVDEEKTVSSWIADMHWRVNAAAVRQFVTRSKETYDWLADKGYKTIFLDFFGEQLHMLPAYDSREGLLRNMLKESVEAKGGKVITNATGRELLTDSTGAVTGAVALTEDNVRLEISAGAVILATGGYAANAEMVKEAFGFEGVNGGLGQNVGEGLKMAWAAGAKVPDNFGGQMLHQTLASATKALMTQYEPFKASYPLMLSYLPNFMNVGPDGARFRDEAATLTAVAAANTSAFNGPFHYVIVSKAQMEALEKAGMAGVHAPSLPGMPPEFYVSFKSQFALNTAWEGIEAVLDSMVANGDGFKGNTAAELAEKAGMDQAIFAKHFAKYQEAIKTGVDGEFGKAAAFLEPMGNTGPYYAIKAGINNLGSVGGLLVNTEFQVLNGRRIPIHGLYAVGLESEGVLFNDTYVGNGVGVGYAFTSGRLGGMYAADEVLKK